MREMAARWQLHRSGRGWRGDCPQCGYSGSFVLSEGTNGRPIGWCASCQASEAIAATIRQAEDCARRPVAVEASFGHAAAAERRKARAVAIWRGASPVTGTPAEVYLRCRGIAHTAGSLSAGFRADTPHPGRRTVARALARIDGPDGAMIALHRTFLRRDGSGKATVEPAKASLAPFAGGAVRLDPVGPELVIGEGLELSASAGRLLSLPAWSAISAGNLSAKVVLPPEVNAVVIAADADEPGERAARDAALRWQREGRRVLIARPKVAGRDFNDLL